MPAVTDALAMMEPHDMAYELTVIITFLSAIAVTTELECELMNAAAASGAVNAAHSPSTK